MAREMGVLISRIIRPLKAFNIENRAHRIISKEKPTPAPKYPSNIEDMKRSLEKDPSIEDKIHKKDSALDERLKDVYVSSFGKPEDDITREIKSMNRDKLFPQDRQQPQEYEYGFKEPTYIPYGHTTIKNVMVFLSAYQTNPEEFTPSKIALEYKLKNEDVENIIKYFKTYEVYIPATEKSPAIFAGPSKLRKSLAKPGNVKEIDSKDTTDENKNI